MLPTEPAVLAPAMTDKTPSRPSTRAETARTFPRTWGEPVALVGALVVLGITFTILNPRFGTLTNLQNILDQSALPLIIGVGATLVILLGSIDLSVEGVMGASGMTFVLLSANSRGGPDLGILAFVAAIAVGTALGAVSGTIYTKVKVPSFIVTLGMWFVGLGIATVLFGTETIPSLTNDELSTWSSQLTFGLPNAFLLAAVVVIGGAALLRFTRLGRVILSIGNNELIARGNGVSVDRFKIFVFIIAGALSGLAGAIASIQLGSGSATVGVGLLFVTIPAVVIGGTSLGGGKGGVLRTALGVILLTVLNNGLILAGVSPNYQSAVSGAILVAAIVAAAWSQRDRLRIAK
ncbi:ABC transporter permease [Salinibacterium sp.]|uniref:ABC transporter permease n=1 Tax=Salinibacterium sp. TaxID=1915057 RepID=UPI00286D1090|nr:ABC transporter permease [Salinibacterium sp.]